MGRYERLIECFPYETPRSSQDEAFKKIAEHWDNTEVFVISAAVGTGKTGMAKTIQTYLIEEKSSCAYLVPNNSLRTQAIEEFPQLRTVKKKSEYWLDKYKMTQEEFCRRHYAYGPKGAQYFKDLAHVKTKKCHLVANYFTYMAHKLYKKNVVIDEAHKLLETLRGLHYDKLWRHQHNYPNGLDTIGALLAWLETQKESKVITKLKKELKSASPSTVINYTEKPYRGEMRECIELLPLSVKGHKEIFWRRDTEKIFLMSATISKKDIEYLGLADKRVTYIDLNSDIPKANRPIVPLDVASMTYRNQETSIPLIAKKIKELAEKHKGEKGFIHANYAVARKLRKHLVGDRYIFHTEDTKKEALAHFLESSDGIMIGSGLTEGLSLDYDKARWQCIAKLQYPSLQDPAMRWIARNEEAYYQWMTGKDVMQATGRNCRTPEDYGVTYILDSSWTVWYNKCKHLLPLWFTEAITKDME